MYSLAITLSVRRGPVEIWASLPDTGYFDPNRYPEHVLASLQSGQATSVVVSVSTVEAALILRPSHHTWPVAFLLTVVMDEHPLLSLEAISYRVNAEQSITEHTRTRLGSVTSIARVGAHKITPGKFSADQRVLEFSPSLPANAVVQ